MKQLIFIGMLLVFNLSFFSINAQVGGSDASGGGNYLETKIRMGKSLAILALTIMGEKELDGFDLNYVQFEFYLRVRLSLAQDLSSSPLIFRPVLMRHLFLLDNDGNSNLIKVDTEEKTAMTKHMPQFPIEINMARCEELRMTEQGAAILLMRESARHLGIQDPSILSEVETIGTIVINKFLLKNSSLLLENFESLKNLDKPFVRLIPYSSIQPNQGEITYISEEMLHYYSWGFDTEAAELILASFKKTEEFLENLGFPIHFEFRGELPKDLYDSEIKARQFSPLDSYNVFYHKDFKSYEREEETTFSQATIHGIYTNFDIFVNKNIIPSESKIPKRYSSDEEVYRPCLCAIIMKSLFRILSLNKVFPWVEVDTLKPTQPHVHFDFLDQFSAVQIQALKEYLMTRVVLVQNSKMVLRVDHPDLSLYETEGGILIKFKPSLLKQIGDNICIIVLKQSSFLGIDSFSKDPAVAHADIKHIHGAWYEDGIIPTEGVYFIPSHLSENPLLANFTGGRLITVPIHETFAQPIKLTLYIFNGIFCQLISFLKLGYATPLKKYELTLDKFTFFQEGNFK